MLQGANLPRALEKVWDIEPWLKAAMTRTPLPTDGRKFLLEVVGKESVGRVHASSEGAIVSSLLQVWNFEDPIYDSKGNPITVTDVEGAIANNNIGYFALIEFNDSTKKIGRLVLKVNDAMKAIKIISSRPGSVAASDVSRIRKLLTKTGARLGQNLEERNQGQLLRRKSGVRKSRNNQAMYNGGIDLSSRNLKMESQGQKVNLTFDPAMIAQFRRGDFSGVRIKIIDVYPVNLMPLLDGK